MGINSTTLASIDAAINTQAVTPEVQRIQSGDNSVSMVPLINQLETSERASQISTKRARTSMFDKFKFAEKT